MNANLIFGKFIKTIRLANGILARDAAQSAALHPTNFSKLEHGALNPPQNPDKQKQLASAIGLKPQSIEEIQFFDLAAKANQSVPLDIADIISTEDSIPLLLRVIGNKRLGKTEIERLTQIVHTNFPQEKVG